MQIGKLRERVAIQTNTPTIDAMGQRVAGWATVATVWAAVEAEPGGPGGNERTRNGEETLVAEARVRVRMRWRVLSPLQRLVWTVRSRTFEVESVQDGTGRREIVALCREVQT